MIAVVVMAAGWSNGEGVSHPAERLWVQALTYAVHPWRSLRKVSNLYIPGLHLNEFAIHCQTLQIKASARLIEIVTTGI